MILSNRLTATLVLRALATLPPALAMGVLQTSHAAEAQAAQGSIIGKVSNKNTGQYLRDVVVQVDGTEIIETSGAGGEFRLNHLPAGPTKLHLSYLGLDPIDVVVEIKPNGVTEQEFYLSSKDYGSDKDVVMLGSFVVSSAREGNAKAINEQKNSIDMKTVIASDAFGDVSEGNVGEFLKLMPGIQVDYTEADVRQVSIGGMDPKYTTVLMDGQPVSSANSSGNGRAFEFEQLSIASIETVELSKTPTPDVDGSAMAGVVNLRSKGAFDRKGRQLRYSVSAALNSFDMSLGKSQGWDNQSHTKYSPNLYVEYSDLFFHNKLGIIAGYNYSFTFSEQKAIAFTYAWDSDITNNATETPKVTQIAYRDSPKPTIRKNYNLRVDYKFNKDLWAWVRIDYNKYNARFFSRDLYFNFPSASTQTATSGVEFSMNSQTNTAATTQIGQGGGATSKHGFTNTPNIGFSFTRGAFKADIQAQYSLATNWYGDTGDGFFWATQTPASTAGTIRWSRPDSKSTDITITQITGSDWRNLANYPNGFTLTRNFRASNDENFSGKADFRYSFAGKIPVLIKTGLSSKEHSRYIKYYYSGTYTYVGADGKASTSDDNISQYQENYRMYFKEGGNVDGVPNIDRWALADLYFTHPEYFTSPTAASLYTSLLKSKKLTREQIDAVYLQTIFKISPKFDIAPGVRIERTKGYGMGPSDIGDTRTKAILGSSVSTTSAEYINTRYAPMGAHYDTYYTALKYLHATYSFRPDLILKASYNESITRPDLDRLFPGVSSIDETNHVVVIGNPDLKPEHARNIYISLEYYPKYGGYASVSVARRDIKSLIRSSLIDIPTDTEYWGTTMWGGWTANTYDNVADAHNESIEAVYNSPQLKFLPGYLKGLSFFANGTAIKYDDITKFLRPRHLFNTGLSYRWKNFSCGWRLNWTGTQRYVATYASTGTTNVTFYAPRCLQDVNAEYNLKRGLSLFMSGRNIWNESTAETYSTRPGVLLRRVNTGAIWNVGVKGTF